MNPGEVRAASDAVPVLLGEMTARDVVALILLAGLLAGPDDGVSPFSTARIAFEFADAFFRVKAEGRK